MTASSHLPACPSWCTLPPDHNTDPSAGLAYDSEGRTHFPPIRSGLMPIGWDDLDGWFCELNWAAHQPSGARLANEFRSVAAQLVIAAEWLERHAG